MGVYSSNRSQIGMYNSDEIIANENYVGEIGALQMMTEGLQNDQAIFESIITADFMEAVAVNEGTNLEVFTEAGAGGFIDKMKELVKKAWEKIKGLFATFIAKINNVIVRDNKKFVDKYKKEVLAKNLGKMKYKWAEPKENGLASVTQAAGALIDSGMSKCAISADFKKVAEECDNGDYLESLLGCEPKEFAKEAHEKCFADEEEEEGLASGRITDCMDILINSSKTLKEVEKVKTEADKTFSKMLKAIDKARNEVLKSIPGGKGAGEDKTVKIGDTDAGQSYNTGDKASKDSAMTRLNCMTKVISISNTFMSKSSAAVIAETKFGIKQARRVFAQAAAFNSKAVKENALLVEAAGEAAEYEVESSFTDYSM